MITITGLTKRYRDRAAVDDLSFTVAAGRVTGFVGPNGAGKSTTMRMMVGLTRPDHGQVRYDGTPYAELERPARTVGAVLDAQAMHPGRTARNHLRAMAALNGITTTRADEVLAEVGLETAANQRAKGFSLGMRQRLALAGALLGRPSVLLLDEPSNGLDPDGIRWLRNHLSAFAQQGGTVFVSSHLIGELAMFADDLVVVGAGRLIAAEPLESITARSEVAVIVASPQAAVLADLLVGRGLLVEPSGDRLLIRGTDRVEVAQLALDHGAKLIDATTRLDLHHLDVENAMIGHPFEVVAAQGSDDREWGTPISNFPLRSEVGDPPAVIVIGYAGADLTGFREDLLTLYRKTGLGWQPANLDCGTDGLGAAIYPILRFPQDDLIAIPICQTGTFALADENLQPWSEIYLPLISR